MSEMELKIYLEDWIKDYCNNDFKCGLPAGVKIFLDRAFEFYTKQAGKSSESLGDYSISFETVNKSLPPSLLSLLHPYRRCKI